MNNRAVVPSKSISKTKKKTVKPKKVKPLPPAVLEINKGELTRLIQQQLLSANIETGSKSWDDYEKAKKLIFKGSFLSNIPGIYEASIEVITEYLDL